MTDILNVLLARPIDHSDPARLGSCHLVMRDSRNRRINARTRLAENTYEYKYERVRDRHETSRILIIDVQIILDILIS